MVPKVSGGFTNLAFTPTHHNRSQMTMLRGSSASLLSNLGHYVTNTGNMVDGVLKRSDMDTNKYLTSEKCKIKSTSQCFKVISATTDPHSEGIIEEKFETDSVAAAEPRVPNSNGIHSAVIQPSDYSSAIAPNCLQKSSKSDDGHFEIGPKTKSLMSNSIFREATTITPETNVFSTYLHTLPPNVMAEYSNRTSDFMIGQISKFQTSDVSQNSKLNVLSSPNSDNSSSDKSNSLLLAPTNSLPEEKEPQPSKTETFPTPQSLKRQGGELIPTDMENLKLQTRDTECDGIVEPATPKTWRPSNDGPTEVPSRGGFLPNFAHQKNMKMELLDFEHVRINFFSCFFP